MGKWTRRSGLSAVVVALLVASACGTSPPNNGFENQSGADSGSGSGSGGSSSSSSSSGGGDGSVISFGDEGLSRSARASFGRGELVVTVGQEALDALEGTEARGIPTLAFHARAGLVGPPAAPAPELLLRVLSTARPAIRLIGAVYGPRSEAAAQATAIAAKRLGLTLIATRVHSGPEAVRALRVLVDHSGISAIWLVGDTDVITAQVFQYALRLQLEAAKYQRDGRLRSWGRSAGTAPTSGSVKLPSRNVPRKARRKKPHPPPLEQRAAACRFSISGSPVCRYQG